jgi:hypothetical protein
MELVVYEFELIRTLKELTKIELLVKEVGGMIVE